MEDTLRTILEIAGGLLTTVVGFALGRRAERASQTIIVRSSMLDTIKEYLQGAERFVGILSDTLASISTGSPGPVLYSLEERRVSARTMSERSNQILGILASKGLNTRKTKRDANSLAALVRAVDSELKDELLPLDLEIQDRALTGRLDPAFVARVAQFKLEMDRRLQDAHRLIARIKTHLA